MHVTVYGYTDVCKFLNLYVSENACMIDCIRACVCVCVCNMYTCVLVYM